MRSGKNVFVCKTNPLPPKKKERTKKKKDREERQAGYSTENFTLHTDQQTAPRFHRTFDTVEDIHNSSILPIVYDISHLIIDRLRDTTVDDDDDMLT